MENRWIWPFELEDKIGSGGMGVVYRARFVKNDRRVALKLLPAELASNPTIVARFERELEILKDLRHPNIVHCFGGATEGAQQYYAMELVEGGTIESVLKQEGRLPANRVTGYMLELCAALAYAHTRGVVHRDIKPGNLLLTRDDKLKLGDFGLALMAAGTKITAAGKTMGTLLYMAPEQIRGNPPVTNKTDLYALGCVLFEMLSGRTPFVGDSAGDILHQHIHTPAPKLTTLVKDCPPEMEALVSELLAKDPNSRPADAWAVAQRLKGFGQTVTIKTSRPEVPLSSQPTRILSVERLAATQVLDVSAPQRPVTPESADFPWKSFAVGTLLLLCAWGLSLTWALPAPTPPGPYQVAESVLIRSLQDADPGIRLAAVRMLGEIGPAARDSLPQLVQGLTDPDPKMRGETLTAVGKMGDEAKRALDILTKVANSDESAEVRQMAATTIEKVNQSTASREPASESGNSFLSRLAVFACVCLLAGGLWILTDRTLK